MSEESNAEIVKLATKSKPVDQRGLRLITYQRGACNHTTATYVVDERLDEVSCGDCGAKLNPHWVLKSLCEQESRWRQRMEEAKKVLAEIEGRTRTQCQHCEQMTPIKLKKGKWSHIP